MGLQPPHEFSIAVQCSVHAARPYRTQRDTTPLAPNVGVYAERIANDLCDAVPSLRFRRTRYATSLGAIDGQRFLVRNYRK